MDLGGYILCVFLGILSVPATRLHWDSAVSKTVGLRPAWNFCAGKADSSNSVVMIREATLGDSQETF